jgi:hypothetical protein
MISIDKDLFQIRPTIGVVAQEMNQGKHYELTLPSSSNLNPWDYGPFLTDDLERWTRIAVVYLTLPSKK